MNYTKELSGHLTLETILRWVEEDEKTPTIADELRKKNRWSTTTLIFKEDGVKKWENATEEEKANELKEIEMQGELEEMAKDAFLNR